MKKVSVIILLFLVLAVSLIRYWYQNRITISAIVPIYNAEKYLAKCLDSILNQTGSFEVIAINDGSTDGSLEILKQYAKKHSNLKIINQKNQGVSAARNAGLKAAKNKYITFIDSDDWLQPDAFEKASKQIKQDTPDILIYNYYDVYSKQWVKDTKGEEAAENVPEESKYPQRNIEKLALFSPFYTKDAISDLYYYGGTSVIHNVFSRKFLEENNLKFPEEINIAEDLVFMYKAFSHNPFISVLNEPVYNYNNRVAGVSKGLEVLNVLTSRINYMRQTSEYQTFPRYVQMWIDDSFINLIFLCIANLQRHNIPISEEKDKIYAAYKTMLKYTPQELKSARNYQRLNFFIEQMELNHLL